MSGIYDEDRPEILYFWIWPDRDLLYRHRRRSPQFEILHDGTWERVDLSEQDWNHLRRLTEQEAAAIVGEEALR